MTLRWVTLFGRRCAMHDEPKPKPSLRPTPDGVGYRYATSLAERVLPWCVVLCVTLANILLVSLLLSLAAEWAGVCSE
jgi:hypothetical protein